MRAEGLWLRGIGAAGAGEREAVLRFRSALESVEGEPAPLLARSLRAWEVALAGDTAAAADSLSALAAESADVASYRRWSEHPFFDGLIRLVAARWMRRSGDPLGAVPLLTWYEAVLPDAGGWSTVRANRVLEPLAHLERVHGEVALGRIERAGWHLDRAMEHLDLPDPAIGPAVEEARAAISAGGPGRR